MVYISPNSRQEMEHSFKDYDSSFSSGNGVHKEKTHLYLNIQTSELLTTACVRRYFSGLNIDDILPLKDKRGALVKFFHSTDAYEGLQRYRKSRDITVIWSSISEWIRHGGRTHYDECRPERKGHHSRSPESLSHSSFRISRSPPRYSRSPQRYSQSRHVRSPPWHSRSPLSHSRSPRMHSRSPCIKSRSPPWSTRSPQNLSNEQHSIFEGDFHVHVTNLKYNTKKEDVRRWFFNLISDHHIMFLYDEKGNRTRECVVMFKNEKDYKKVLKLDKVTFDGRLIFISSISKSSIRNLLTDSKALLSHHYAKGKCLYLRNFPSDVTKSDILKFFSGFSLNEEDVSLLCKRDGVGIGEVLVSLSSDEDLEKADKLHRKKFKDKEIPIRRLPEEKLLSFLSSNSLSLMPENPYDCVTQEDDLLEEESDQEKNISDKEDDTPQEESSCHQTDNAHEYVTQADDASEESPVHVEEEPSAMCSSDEESILIDNDFVILEDATSEDEGLRQ
ncbi:RNA-binding protein 12B-B-like isoform 2-T3 [Leptodactylus fuscus]|uniref:RNA-binding protein 12B-B-like isoform X2 n=1 Tax=Leptodactylus fuscus TaxID=238119 RepID=UPI003F4E9138